MDAPSAAAMSTPASPAWRAAHATLAESTLGDVMGAGCWTPAAKLLTLSPGATAGEALQLMAAAHVLSAPVLADGGVVKGVAEARAAAAAFLRSYGAVILTHTRQSRRHRR